MYRACIRNSRSPSCLLRKQLLPIRQTKKWDSSSTSGKVASTWIKYAIGSVFGGSGIAVLGGLGYAGYDKEFRQTLGSYNEYVKIALDTLFPDASVLKKKDDKFVQEPDDVVVVTTIDHHPGISIVDLDISNMDEKRKKAKRKAAEEPKESDGFGVGEEEEIKGETIDTPVQMIGEEEIKDTEEAPNAGNESSLAKELDLHIQPESVDKTNLVEIIPDEAGSIVAKATEAAEVEAAETTEVVEITKEEKQEAAVVLDQDTKIVDSEIDTTPSADKGDADDNVINKTESLDLIPEDSSTEEVNSEKMTIETLIQVKIDNLLLEGQEVINAQKRAAGTIYTYVNQLGNALAVPQDDPSFYEVWKTTSDLEKESQGAIDEARTKEISIQEKIVAVRGMMSAVRKYGESEIANKAQTVTSSISLKVQRASSDITNASSNLTSMVEYHALAAKAKKEFEKGLAQISQEVSDTGTDEEVRKEGTNPLLVYALKKVEFLNTTLENRASEEEARVLAALEKQQEEEDKRFQQLLAAEIKRTKEEDSMEQQKKETELVNHYEVEMRTQLKRQASAHREHLADVLKLQADELNETNRQNLESKLCEQQRLYEDELDKKVAFLKGVDKAVSFIVDVEEEIRHARELWLVVQALFSAFQEPVFNGVSRALMPEIIALRSQLGENETVQEVISSIPPIAARKGVVTEAELSRQFKKVKSLSRKVAMVDANEGSLGSYLMSFLRSFLIFDTLKAEDINEPIDPNNINTYQILAKAEKCIKMGDLEQAVKFMNLLNGVSRHVAQDWLNDARVHLETKLALDFILAYARSKGLGAVL